MSGTTVYTATATDIENDAISYALTGTDASAFSINSSTGVVTINATPDFEAKSSYSFNVKASDPSGAFNAQTVTLNINNVNEAPVLTGFGPSITFSEDTVNATSQIIDGVVVFTDPEGNFNGGALTVTG